MRQSDQKPVDQIEHQEIDNNLHDCCGNIHTLPFSFIEEKSDEIDVSIGQMRQNQLFCGCEINFPFRGNHDYPHRVDRWLRGVVK